jgi:hypothetical protein
MGRLRLALLVVLTCSCAGEATPPPAPTPHGVVAHYDHLPTAADIALIAATGGMNIVTIRLANCLWFQTVVSNTTLDSLPGVQADLVDDSTNVEPVYVFYASAATPSDSAILDSLSSAPRSAGFISDSIMSSTMKLAKIDLLARDPNARAVYIVHDLYYLGKRPVHN